MSDTKRKIRKGCKGNNDQKIVYGDDTQAQRAYRGLKMKPYAKKPSVRKFEKEKYNRKMGIVTVTKSSKLEAKNANRSIKKAARQQAKKEIKNQLK